MSTSEALHCYTSCQPRTTPEAYLECLATCPGFERTPGVACTPEEVPPVAACVTARRVPAGSEPEPGAVVIGVFAGHTFVVGLASVCAASELQCQGADGR